MPKKPSHQSLVTRGSQSLATNHPCFQTSGLAQGACRPLIERKRFSGFCRFCSFYGFKGVGAAQIIMNNEAPWSFDSASRCHHFERSREIYIAERSLPDVRQYQDIVSPQCIHADSCRARDPSAALGMTMPKNPSHQSLVTRGSHSLATHSGFQTSVSNKKSRHATTSHRVIFYFCQFIPS